MMTTPAALAALTATVLGTELPGVRASKAAGFVEVKATALRAEMVTSMRCTILSVRRAPARVWWAAASNKRGEPFMEHPNAVLVTIHDPSYGKGSPDRIREIAYHPDYWFTAITIESLRVGYVSTERDEEDRTTRMLRDALFDMRAYTDGADHERIVRITAERLDWTRAEVWAGVFRIVSDEAAGIEARKAGK